MSMLLMLLCTAIGATKALEQCESNVVVGPMFVNYPRQQVFVAEAGGAKSGGVLLSPNGTSVTLRHGRRVYIAEKCESEFEADMYMQWQLLGKTLHFTVDLSRVSCGCNAALYLVSMPGYNAEQQPDPSQCKDYYCDANKVCGNYCPEIDLIEANMHALQMTLHKCDAPDGHFFSRCDHGGCGENTRTINKSDLGPSEHFTINTKYPFNMSMHFGESAGRFTSMSTELTQGSHKVTVSSKSCANGYLDALTNTLKGGMVMVSSYWGSDGAQMSWLDIPPCSVDANCDTSGSFTVGNIFVT